MKPNLSVFRLLLVLALAVGYCAISECAEFSAIKVSLLSGMITTVTEQGPSRKKVTKEPPWTQKLKIYVKGGKRREEGGNRESITRPDKRVTWLLFPGKRTYVEYKIPAKMAAGMLDPKSLRKQIGSARPIGKAMVNGYLCEKYQSRGERGEAPNIVWYSSKLNEILRIQGKLAGDPYNMEITKIREGKQPDSLFEIPKGYKRVKSPDWNSLLR